MLVALAGSMNLSGWFDHECQAAEPAPPLGILSLAAVLETGGHSVDLLDFNRMIGSGEIATGDEFYEDAARRLLAGDPAVVGLSTMCSSFHVALRVAQAVKRQSPKTWVVMGGPQASVADRMTLDTFPFVDVVVRGEAEATVCSLLHELEARGSALRTPGVTWRHEGQVVRNPGAGLVQDLDSLPIPAYHLLAGGPGAATAVDAGRGCPFGCSFCSTSSYWGRRYRVKSEDRLIQELEHLSSTYGTREYSLLHDLFTLDQARVERFCARLSEMKLDWSWSCSARIDCVTPDLIETMGQSGCRGIFFGVETGSPRMQRLVGKNLRLGRFREIVDAAVGSGMAVTASFIAGFPEETEEDLACTMTMIEGLLGVPKVSVQLHLLGPELETPYYARYRSRLRFDGYFSDITGTETTFVEEGWFRTYPGLFPSFYYYDVEGLPRTLLRGLDLFVHAPCGILPRTLKALCAGGESLLDVYRAWSAWRAGHRRGDPGRNGEELDDFVMDFYAFVGQHDNGAPLDMGVTRDEVLAFYLQHYGNQPVRFNVERDTSSMEEMRGGKA